jgi:hypothetical protein
VARHCQIGSRPWREPHKHRPRFPDDITQEPRKAATSHESNEKDFTMKRISVTPLLVLVIAMTLQVGCSQSSDVDAVLDELESITDETVTIVDKMDRGDMSGLQDMVRLQTRYRSLASKLERLEDGAMTETQTDRYQRILSRFQRAMAARM